jgi:HAD superfamily hydrolase (TIGR01509 family)
VSFKAIILDVDGTLSETEETHRQAFNETFAEFGLGWVWTQDLYGTLLKTTGGKERMAAYVRQYLKAEPDMAKIAEIHARKTARYGQLIAQGAAALRPGIADLIRDAKNNGVRLAVATTTNRPNVDRLTEACFNQPAGEVFEVIAAGDAVKNKKPAPDVFNLAVQNLGLQPQECVGLEDSRNGLLACHGAGVPCIVSPCRYTRGSDFSEARAVVNSFGEVDTVARLNAALGG